MNKFILKGIPTPLARARYSTQAIWDSQKELKVVRGIELAHQHNDQGFLEGPLHMDVIFYFPVAKSLPKRTRAQRTGGYHSFKPDLSNLIKFVEDIAHDILYKDDCIISSINAEKRYDHDPRTEVTFTKCKETNPEQSPSKP